VEGVRGGQGYHQVPQARQVPPPASLDLASRRQTHPEQKTQHTRQLKWFRGELSFTQAELVSPVQGVGSRTSTHPNASTGAGHAPRFSI